MSTLESAWLLLSEYIWDMKFGLVLKLAMLTTAHSHTVSVDAVWTHDDDTFTKIVGHHSYLAGAAANPTTRPWLRPPKAKLWSFAR